MIKKLRKISRELFYLDTSIPKNCESIKWKDKRMLLKVNVFLYDLLFNALHKYWLINKREKNTYQRPTVTTVHLKNDPYWLQLHAIENFLTLEYQNLKYGSHMRNSNHPCLGCVNLIWRKDGYKNKKRNIVNIENCNHDVSLGKCMNIKKVLDEF